MERSARANFVLAAIGLMAMGAGFFAWAHAQVIGVTLPSVPGGVIATVGSAPGQISVTWSASTESSGTIAGYYVYRNGVQVAATADVSYIDAGLQSGYYGYTVAAYDSKGYQSQQSSPPANVTLVADKTAPTAPGVPAVTGATSSNSYYAKIPVTISWGASTDNVGVVGYYVYRNNMPITSSTSAFTDTSMTDTVPPGTYTYTIAAYDAAQNISPRSAATAITIAIDTTAPSVPTGVSAQQVSADDVNVTWSPSTDQNGLAGYELFRNGLQIASPGGSSYSDSGLATNVQYSYTVAAYDIAGNVSSQSQPPANVTVQPFSGPSAPVIVSTLLLGTSSARIAWATGADPLAVTGYSIYRDGGAIATVTSTNYIDEGLPPGLHVYNLTQSDISGQASPLSATSTIIIPIATTPGAITSQVTVVAPIASASAATATPSVAAITAITQSLYYGLRNEQVTAMQTVLTNNGYLASGKATGFFGSLTLSALQKFQCDKKIACSGGAGWGIVGPKTRAALNALSGGTATSATPSADSQSAILAQIQMLQTMLANLQKQLPTGGY